MMKRSFYLGLLTLILFASCADKPKQQQAQAPPAETANLALYDPFYKRFEGMIAGREVVMQLHNVEGRLMGSYYYRKSGQFIDLYGSMSGKDSVLLEEHVSEQQREDYNTPAMRLTLHDSLLAGTWISADGTKQFEVKLTERYPEGSLRYRPFYFKDSIQAFPGVDSSAVTEFSYGWLMPDHATGAMDDSATAFITRIMAGVHARPGEVVDSLKAAARGFFEDYRKEVLSEGEVVEDKSSSMYSYATNNRLTIRYNEHGFLVLEDWQYMYSGGAHGLYAISGHNIDLLTGKELQLEDVISGDSIALAALVEGKLRKQYGLSATEALDSRFLVDALPGTFNFFLNEKGISFVYNPYEIASFADGIVEVFVPFEELNAFITPSFKTILQRIKPK